MSEASCLGAAAMPKRGLDRTSGEVFRFYRLIVSEQLVEPLSVTVPRRQVRIRPGTFHVPAAPPAAVTAQEWLQGSERAVMSVDADAHLHKPYLQSLTEGAGPKTDVTEEVPD